MKQSKAARDRTSPIERIYRPFPRIAVVVFEDFIPGNALAMARSLEGRVGLVGFVAVPKDESLSSGTLPARELRQKLDKLSARLDFDGSNHVRVSYNRWYDLQAYAREKKPDLLLMEWPETFDFLDVSPHEALRGLGCNVALLRGPWPKDIGSILVPLRGGYHAALALRLVLALPRRDISVLHLMPSENLDEVEPPFQGLDRVLPRMPEVLYEKTYAPSPLEAIKSRARNCDLLVIGTTANPVEQPDMLGPIAGQLVDTCDCALVVVNSQFHEPVFYRGVEGVRTGARAISVLVDKWFAENTYHAAEFEDLAHLVELKEAQGVTISLALPALNEEETVGNVIHTIRSALVSRYPLVDEIVLLDSNSTDRTRQIAADLGVQVYIHQELLPEYTPRHGKGDALWKSLYVTRGDLVMWIDTDIVNIHPRFVYGVLGPLLVDPDLQYVKGFYQRPIRSGKTVQATGGGRVTELTARPLLNLFFPELSGVIQPLSGEYGGRRSALEQLPFFSGYGVETGLLIDVFEKFGLSAIAQVDLLERIHHNQPLEALSKMSFTILQAFLRKLEVRINQPLLEDVNRTMKLIRYRERNYYLEVEELPEMERPPMIEIPEYLARHHQVEEINGDIENGD